MGSISAQKIELWPLARLKPYAQNARQHSPEQVEKIAVSIDEYGFNNPILVDTKDGIIAGHGRLEAAKLLELDTVPVIILDHLSDAQRRAYILADNRLAELAQWDDELLLGELDALSNEGFDVAALGWDESELDDLQAELDELIGEDELGGDLADESQGEKTAFHFEFELNDFLELQDRVKALRKRWKLETDADVFANLVRGAN